MTSGTITGADYLTLALGDDAAAANARIDEYLEQYYGAPADVLRRRQACFAGSEEALADWLAGYAAAGAGHIVLRFVGDHHALLETVARIRPEVGRERPP